MNGSFTTASPPTAATYAAGGNSIGLNWGSSSDHSGKLVGHLFADGHIEFISSDVAPGVYMSLHTRNSAEPIQEY
jgi:hypothetical protein